MEPMRCGCTAIECRCMVSGAGRCSGCPELDVEQLRAEVERLRAELTWEQKATNDSWALCDALQVERDSLREQLQRMTEERDTVTDHLRVTNEQIHALEETVALNVERDTAEAIAAWLPQFEGTYLEWVAMQIRAGAWRGKGEP